jgi:hypothetical protein
MTIFRRAAVWLVSHWRDRTPRVGPPIDLAIAKKDAFAQGWLAAEAHHQAEMNRLKAEADYYRAVACESKERLVVNLSARVH